MSFLYEYFLCLSVFFIRRTFNMILSSLLEVICDNVSFSKASKSGIALVSSSFILNKTFSNYFSNLFNIIDPWINLIIDWGPNLCLSLFWPPKCPIYIMSQHFLSQKIFFSLPQLEVKPKDFSWFSYLILDEKNSFFGPKLYP